MVATATRLAVLVALVLALGPACTQPAADVGPKAPASATVPAEKAPAGAPDPRVRERSALRLPDPVVHRLEASVESVAAEPGGTAAPEELASALRGMASALELLPGATWQRVKGVRDVARELASHETAPDRFPARLLGDGLRAAERVLVDVDPPPAHETEFQATVSSLGTAIEELEPEAPMAHQHRTVLRAFRAAADAILLAGGRERQFSGKSSPLPPGSPDAFAASVTVASSAVETLAQARMTGSRRAASDALLALAKAIEAAPDRPDRVTGMVAEVRFQAERLRRADPMSFGESRWIQLGLAAALDALEALSSGRAAVTGQWLAAGRRATEAIAPDQSLSFQRAAVQDALRAVVDAFKAAPQPCREDRPAG